MASASHSNGTDGRLEQTKSIIPPPEDFTRLATRTRVNVKLGQGRERQEVERIQGKPRCHPSNSQKPEGGFRQSQREEQQDNEIDLHSEWQMAQT